MSKPVPLCQGLKDDRSKCGSPALRGGTLCYYHHRRANRTSIPAAHPVYAIPDLTSARNIRKANETLLRLLYEQRYTPKEIATMQHGLQIAQGALRDLNGTKRKRRRNRKKAGGQSDELLQLIHIGRFLSAG